MLHRIGVKFLIGQVGSSGEAVEFLQALKGNTEIAKVAHIFAGMCISKYQTSATLTSI